MTESVGYGPASADYFFATGLSAKGKTLFCHHTLNTLVEQTRGGGQGGGHWKKQPLATQSVLTVADSSV